MNKKIVLYAVLCIMAAFGILYTYSNKDQQMKKLESALETPSIKKEDFTKVLDTPANITIVGNQVLYIYPHSVDDHPNRISIPIQNLLFVHKWSLDEKEMANSSVISLNPDNTKIYDKIGYYNTTKRIAFVYPIFTQAAYSQKGFYDYYAGVCDSCLTVDIPKEVAGKYPSSIRASAILSLLNYPHISDIDIDKNPDVLKNYDRIILLHNEYVTKREFDAITGHPDVVYLYPNSLYAEVKSDFEKNTITLVRGHTYPTKDISNGFDWKFDNTKYEYDVKCDDWKFEKIDNGKMLNCYPSFRLSYDEDLLLELKN